MNNKINTFLLSFFFFFSKCPNQKPATRGKKIASVMIETMTLSCCLHGTLAVNETPGSHVTAEMPAKEDERPQETLVTTGRQKTRERAGQTLAPVENLLGVVKGNGTVTGRKTESEKKKERGTGMTPRGRRTQHRRTGVMAEVTDVKIQRLTELRRMAE